MGLDAWRIYCVEWNTRNASPAKKSREESKPATGRRRNPVQAERIKKWHLKNSWCVWFILIQTPHSEKKFVNCLLCSPYVKQSLIVKEQGIFHPCVPPSQYLSICTIVPLEVLEKDLRHGLSVVPKHHREPVIKQGLLFCFWKHYPHWQLRPFIRSGSFICFKLTLQEFWNIFKLGNVVLPVATVLLQQWEHVVVFITSMSRIETLQLPEDGAPCFLFFFCVGNSRNRLATGKKMNTIHSSDRENVLCHQHHTQELNTGWPGTAGAEGEMPLAWHAGAKGASLAPRHRLGSPLLTSAEIPAFRNLLALLW